MAIILRVSFAAMRAASFRNKPLISKLNDLTKCFYSSFHHRHHHIGLFSISYPSKLSQIRHELISFTAPGDWIKCRFVVISCFSYKSIIKAALTVTTFMEQTRKVFLLIFSIFCRWCHELSNSCDREEGFYKFHAGDNSDGQTHKSVCLCRLLSCALCCSMRS